MSSFGDGLKKSVGSMISGFLLSALISGLVDQNPDVISVKSVFNILSVFGIIETIENANFWGLSYTLGYFAGVTVFGKYFVEPWESALMLIIFLIYAVSKLSN